MTPADAASGATPPRRIRVLYVIWSLQMGGAEHVVASLARGLDRSRFEPMVACLNFKGRLAEELESEGIRVFDLQKKPKLDLAVLYKLIRLMREQKVDVVHTHLWTSGLWGRMAASIARVPAVVVTEHDLDEWRGLPQKLADRVLARCTDQWIFVSDRVKDFYLDYIPLRPDRYRVVHNGIDTRPFEKPVDRDMVKRKLGIPLDKRVVGSVGRLAERKGHRFFVEAMKTVAAADPGVVGIVVGEGNLMPALQAQRDSLGLGDAMLLPGYWPSIAEVLSVIDVFVLPSLMEGHPLAVLEAMAAALPVVATRVGGNAEAVKDGVTGLLVPAQDPPALAAALLELLRDPDRARRMGQEGRRLLDERFSREGALRANEEIYLRLCGDRAQR